MNALKTPLQSPLLSRKEAAAYLGVAEGTLAVWKSTGRYSLTCIKVGRLAKYKKVDLDNFIASRSRFAGGSDGL